MRKRTAVVRLSSYPADLLVRREVEAIASLGSEVHVYCLREPGEPAEDTVAGVIVHRLPLGRQKRSALRNLFEYVAFFWLSTWALTFAHLRRPFQVIQVNTLPDFLVFATLVPKLFGAKVTLQMYEPMAELWETRFTSRIPIALIRQVALWAVAYADHVFTVTQQLKDVLVARGADARKITVVLNAPDTRLFSELEAAEHKNSPGLRLLCIGAIEERYGHDTMLHAIANLRNELPGLQMRITGDGGWRDEFLALRATLGLQDCVHYLGYISVEALTGELHQADAGLVAQKASPYSHLVHTGKMYDYLAFGKPVIASRLNAVTAYFGDDSLCYFEPGDALDLARAIREFAHSPAKRRQWHKRSQQLYARYQWDRQRDVYLDIYRRWLNPAREMVSSIGSASQP